MSEHDKYSEKLNKTGTDGIYIGAETGETYYSPEYIKRLDERGLMSEWISVEDRLPEHNQIVLVFNKNWLLKNMSTDLFLEKGGRKWFLMYRDVTHWMPLPEPPE